MKISTFQIPSFIASLGKNSFSCLLYGVDYGVKTDTANEIEKAFLGKEYAKNIINIDFSNVSGALDAMFAEVLNYDLLPTKKIIKIKSAGNKLTQSIQFLLSKVAQLNKDIFLILIADELDSKSSLRLLYEAEHLLASIACYSDTPEASTQLISLLLNKHKIQFNPDVPKFIASCFTEDRMALKNEIDKILLNMVSDKNLTIEMCKKVIDTSLTYTPDIFLDSIGMGDFKTASIELDRAFNEGNTSVGIIRFMFYHFLKLKDMASNIKAGSNIDQEIAKNRIFFKRIPNYKKQLSNLTINKINIVLDKLFNIETKVKQYNEEIGILILKLELSNL